MKYLFLIISVVLIFSCNNNKKSKLNVDFNLTKLSKSLVTNNVNSYKVIPLETTDEAYLNSIRKILIYKDKIFLLDRLTGGRDFVYVFSLNGEYLNKINRQGRGAHEYMSISDFDIHPKNETIDILDPGSRKLFSFNLNSEYLNEVKLNFGAKEFKYFTEGSKLYKAYSTKASILADDGVGRHIYVYDENNNFLYSALPFINPLGVTIGNGIFLLKNETQVEYLKPNTNIVYSIKSNNIEIKYLLEFPNDVMPQDITENVFLHGKKNRKGYIYGLEYFESNNFIYTSFMYEKQPYWGLFDKYNKESIIFNHSKNPSCNCGVNLKIKGVYENYFIVQTDYLNFNNVIDLLDPTKEKCLNPNVFKTIEQLDMTSNPILILVEFKFDDNK